MSSLSLRRSPPRPKPTRAFIAQALLASLTDADRIGIATGVLTSVRDPRHYLSLCQSASAIEAHAISLARQGFELEAG